MATDPYIDGAMKEEELLAKLPEHLSKYIKIEGGHMIWTGKPTKDGYGQVRDGNKVKFAHRAVFEHVKGEIKKGRHLFTTCNTHMCVHPDHHMSSAWHKVSKML